MGYFQQHGWALVAHFVFTLEPSLFWASRLSAKGWFHYISSPFTGDDLPPGTSPGSPPRLLPAFKYNQWTGIEFFVMQFREN